MIKTKIKKYLIVTLFVALIQTIAFGADPGISEDYETETVGSIPSNWSGTTGNTTVAVFQQDQEDATATNQRSLRLKSYGTDGYNATRSWTKDSSSSLCVMFDFYADYITNNGSVQITLKQGEWPWNDLVNIKIYSNKITFGDQEVTIIGDRWYTIRLSDFDFTNYTYDIDLAPRGAELQRISTNEDMNVSQYGASTICNLRFSEVSQLTTTSTVYIDQFNVGYDLEEPFQDAKDNIPSVRQAQLQVQVLDEWSNTLAGAQIEIELIKHDFIFGSEANAYYINPNDTTGKGNSTDGSDYRDAILNTFKFNTITIGHRLCWEPWDDQSPTPGTDAVNWCYNNSLDVWGAHLVWPTYLPLDIRWYYSDPNKTPQYCRDACTDHIYDEVDTLSGKISYWNVANEMNGGDGEDFRDHVGDAAIVDWFEEADDTDSSPVLILNDAGILAVHATQETQQDEFYDLADYLVDNSAPIDAIAIQCHFREDFPDPKRLMDTLDTFDDLGLDIYISEFDYREYGTTDAHKDYQLAQWKAFMTYAYSHSAVKGVQVWGFWEEIMNVPSSALVDDDFTTTDIGQAWLDLVWDEWYKEETGYSGANGWETFNGCYKGRYKITVSKSGYLTKVYETDVTSNKVVYITLEQ